MSEVVKKKKRVSVTFAGNDDCDQAIIPINERKSSLRQTKAEKSRKRKSVSYAEDVIERVEEDEDEDDTENEDEVFKPSRSLAEGTDVSGMEMYGFKSLKKSGQMAQKASESTAGNRTPKSKSQTGTPRSTSKNLQDDDMSTPKKRVRKPKNGKDTPSRLRARNKEGDSDMSSDDSVSSGSSDSEDEAKTTAPGTPKGGNKSVKTATPSRKKRTEMEDEGIEVAEVEGYFESQEYGSVTSDRTLAKLEMPRMDAETLTKTLEAVRLNYEKERKVLYDEHKSCFKKWMYQMCRGFNILLHGLGSKRRLIEDFRVSFLSEYNHLVINGYFPSLTMKSILNSITEDVIEHRGNFRNPIDQVEFIKQHYECGDHEDFHLVIHNIDGVMLRNEKSQMILSLMAKIRGFHIIASLDHINAPLLWDQTKLSRYNWLWNDCTTFDTYSEETSYENSLLVQQSGVLALSSLTHVMKSLTPNARGIFFLLAKYQLNNKDNPSYNGLAFADLYQKCREAFLVNSDLTLRTQLTEFKDHKLIRTKKGIDGMEYLVIPLEHATLSEFLDQHEQENSS